MPVVVVDSQSNCDPQDTTVDSEEVEEESIL